MSALQRISVTVEEELLERFDDLIEESGHRNRSEAVRDLIRARLVEEDLGEDSTLAVATVTIVYDHRQRELADKLVAAQHHSHDLTLATLHVHLTDEECLEVVAMQGPMGELRRFAEHLVGMKGVKHGKAVFTAGRA